MQLRSIGMLYLLSMSCGVNAGEVVRLDNFAGDSVKVPAPWQVIQLDKKVAPTDYRVSRWDGVSAIEATAEHSMALLARPVEIIVLERRNERTGNFSGTGAAGLSKALAALVKASVAK